ncbi:response regulator [Rubeoparvulum massiliense]|uniref:response regulator n=1 Tax=Rubeoparvulum massiliense TaxID=1631346 RepID=UPI00065E23AF|nr:response regulator [Rubeoparvulum massiliense]
MLRAIIVDDEPLAIQLLVKRLNEVGGVEVVKTFNTAESMLDEMKKLDFQVAFLDIEMVGISGLDLAELIQVWNRDIHIVFVTAYRDYAVQAFELASIDYLLKPVLNNRLEKTVARLQEHQAQLSNLSNLSNHDPNLSTDRLVHGTSSFPALRVICFGEFMVYHQEVPVKWKTAKVKELFAFFITHYNTYMNRDTIIECLWPEYDYKKAKILLHTCISHLRKTLDSLGYQQALIFFNQSYILQLDHFYCDAFELEQALDEDPMVTEENITRLETIIQNYTGVYMETNAYPWAVARAEELIHKYDQLLQKMNHYYTQSNELDKREQCLHLLYQCNPYSDQVVQQLMLHYRETGNRGEAIRIYQQFATLLDEELGIAPDHTTQALYHTIT